MTRRYRFIPIFWAGWFIGYSGLAGRDYGAWAFLACVLAACALLCRRFEPGYERGAPRRETPT